MFSVIDSKDGRMVYRTFEQLSREHKGMDEAFYTDAFKAHVIEDGDNKIFIYKEEQ